MHTDNRTSAKIELSIVLISYNTKQITKECIESILKSFKQSLKKVGDKPFEGFSYDNKIVKYTLTLFTILNKLQKKPIKY